MGGIGKLVIGIWGWARLTSVGEEARSQQGSGERADPRTKVFSGSIKNTAWSVGTGLPLIFSARTRDQKDKRICISVGGARSVRLPSSISEITKKTGARGKGHL